MINPAFSTQIPENPKVNGDKTDPNGFMNTASAEVERPPPQRRRSTWAQLPTMSDVEPRKPENRIKMVVTIVVPFFIAGFGMVAAGILFDAVQSWDLYINLKEIIVLVPALLGLKGNLEMTLASRLSTQVNLKMIHDKETTKRAVIGNFCLTQLQSIVVGFLASFVACLTEYIIERKFYPSNLLIIIGSSVGTASLASLLLGGLIMAIILISERYKINPDNVATPIASSLGDLVTLAILSGLGTFLYTYRSLIWIHIILIVIFVLMIPVLGFLSYKNEFVKDVLFHGWVPVIIAMVISSAAGIILEFAIKTYPGVAIFQPVVNGVGGNLVAIYCSRLCTTLHETSEPGEWAPWAPAKWFQFPFETFYSKLNREWKTCVLLMSLIIPGHLVFFFILFAVQKEVSLSVQLVFFYLGVGVVQVTFLMVMCYCIVHLVWRLNQNPDNFCIPLLTATGDLLGVGLLYFCFFLTEITGDASVRLVEFDEAAAANSTVLLASTTSNALLKAMF